ncbi:MAG: hypothetical protein UY92_C0023G0008, partial [Candidatus Magasanikbacteria bacterium GW2011_GWA2_56_11]
MPQAKGKTKRVNAGVRPISAGFYNQFTRQSGVLEQALGEELTDSSLDPEEVKKVTELLGQIIAQKVEEGLGKMADVADVKSEVADLIDAAAREGTLANLLASIAVLGAQNTDEAPDERTADKTAPADAGSLEPETSPAGDEPAPDTVEPAPVHENADEKTAPNEKAGHNGEKKPRPGKGERQKPAADENPDETKPGKDQPESRPDSQAPESQS